MYNIIVFCALVLVLPNDVYSQCNDCINYDRCPEAVNLVLYNRNSEALQLFRKASCGFDNSGTIPKAKVCCSLFSTQDTAEDIRIANHKNLKYLPDDCGFIQCSRLGYRTVQMYEFPWMAIIAYETRDGLQFKCGASIINKRYVLTAAHCVQNKTIVGVRVGEYDIDTHIDCDEYYNCEKHLQDIEVEESVIHENYTGIPMFVNNIALLRLSEDIDFNHRNVHRICLPKTKELRNLVVENKTATVIGWRLTKNYRDSSIPVKVRIPIQTAQRCSDVYNRNSKPGAKDTTADQLCAGAPDIDSCIGDGGDPLILEELYGNTYKFIQYGIDSHGPRECLSEYPSVYTDVRKYMGWILDKMRF